MQTNTIINALLFRQFIRVFAPIAIFILLNPLCGALMAFVQLIKSSDDWKNNRSEVVSFLLAVSIWISLVNITKTISSDQLAYAEFFLEIPNTEFYAAVFETWAGSGKEPVFAFITWGLYYLCGGSLRLFFFILSNSIYLFLFFAAYRLFRKVNFSKGTLICGIMCIVFFSQYFVMTLHIIRQVLAASVVVYAIVYRATEGKNLWVLILSAPFIHTSAFFLVGLSLIPWFYSWMNFKRILLIFACFIPFIIFSQTIGTILMGTSEISALSYAGARLEDEGASDGGVISGGILISLFIPLGACAMYLLKYIYKNERNAEFPMSPIAYLIILLMFFVLLFSKTPIIQYRFFIYSYSFIPLLIPTLFYNTKLHKLYLIGISSFFIVRFFITYGDLGFHYAPVIDIVLQPSVYYFIEPFNNSLY